MVRGVRVCVEMPVVTVVKAKHFDVEWVRIGKGSSIVAGAASFVYPLAYGESSNPVYVQAPRAQIFTPLHEVGGKFYIELLVSRDGQLATLYSSLAQKVVDDLTARQSSDAYAFHGHMRNLDAHHSCVRVKLPSAGGKVSTRVFDALGKPQSLSALTCSGTVLPVVAIEHVYTHGLRVGFNMLLREVSVVKEAAHEVLSESRITRS